MHSIGIALKDFVSNSPTEIIRQARPTKDDNAKVNSAIDSLAIILQNLSPASIVKSGSYSKGTQVVGHDEVDVVLLFQGFAETSKDVEAKLEEVRSCLSNANVMMEPRKRPLLATIDGVRLDILVGGYCEEDEFEMLVQTRASLDIDAPKESFYCSAPYQRDFIKGKDCRFKDFVRYCKVWRNSWDWNEGARPGSFLLELLCLAAYERTDSSNYNIEGAFLRFLRLLQQDHLFLGWSCWYDHVQARKKFHDFTRVVLDPGDPLNNVANSLTDWSVLQARASETQTALESPMAYGFVTIVNALKAEIKELVDQNTLLRSQVRQLQLSNRLCMTVKGAKALFREGVGFCVSSPITSMAGLQRCRTRLYPAGIKSAAGKAFVALEVLGSFRTRYSYNSPATRIAVRVQCFVGEMNSEKTFLFPSEHIQCHEVCESIEAERALKGADLTFGVQIVSVESIIQYDANKSYYDCKWDWG